MLSPVRTPSGVSLPSSAGVCVGWSGPKALGQLRKRLTRLPVADPTVFVATGFYL